MSLQGKRYRLYLHYEIIGEADTTIVNCQLSIVNFVVRYILLPWGIGFTKNVGGGTVSAKFTDLNCKEVICISDGRRLGFIQDVIIQLPKGEVSAIVVPGRCKLGGLGPPRDDFVIPWCNICRIGPDIVLVDIKPDDCKVLRGKPRLMF